MKALALWLCCLLSLPLFAAERFTVAAAANLQPAMTLLIEQFERAHPEAQVEPVYGASGKLTTQIQQGAPFDLFFSADVAFAQTLFDLGLAAAPPRLYARGRIVLWSATVDASQLALKDLADTRFRRIAIANPRVAPYGARAEEALRASGVWASVEPRLVFGESIAQTAQFVETGNAQIGLIALSQALYPQLAAKGGYALIPEALHQPLEQGFVVLKRAAENPLAAKFADFIASPAARAVLQGSGFALPATPAP